LFVVHDYNVRLIRNYALNLVEHHYNVEYVNQVMYTAK
jgi:hypothetical protein